MSEPRQKSNNDDQSLLMAAAEYIESMVTDMQFNVPEPEASQIAACRRIAKEIVVLRDENRRLKVLLTGGA